MLIRLTNNPGLQQLVAISHCVELNSTDKSVLPGVSMLKIAIYYTAINQKLEPLRVAEFLITTV